VDEQAASPFPGPRPFEASEAPVFFGRAVETPNVVSLVIAHRTLVLYADSGAGKSSLLNAGVIPVLRARGVGVYPVSRVGATRGDRLEESGNVFVRSVAATWAPRSGDPEPVGQSLPELLRGRAREELPEDGLGLRVLVLDQFEELFTAHQEHWPDRRAFVEQVQQALDADPALRVIFAIRSDYIASLGPLAALMDDRFRHRFHLERLRQPAALAAVQEPAARAGRPFAADAAKELVTDLMQVSVEGPEGETIAVPGEFVEPVQLQIVCRGLWESLPANVGTIELSHVTQYADVGKALAHYYREAVDAVAGSVGTEALGLRQWFDRHLITAANTRGTVFRGAKETGGLPNDTVVRFEDHHLIRAEVRAGSTWYELSHDLFIPAILADNRRYYEAIAEKRRRLLRIVATLGTSAVAAVTVLAIVLFGVWQGSVGVADQSKDRLDDKKKQLADVRAQLLDLGHQRDVTQNEQDAQTAGLTRDAILKALGHDGLIVFTSDRKVTGTNQLYVINADGTGEQPVLTDGLDAHSPAVSPEGKRIVFARNVADKELLFMVGMDGSGLVQLTSDGNDSEPAWSPDGKQIAFRSDRGRDRKNYKIYVMPATPGARATRLTVDSPAKPDAVENYPVWIPPDGGRIAFESTEDGVGHIWRKTVGGSDQTRLTSGKEDELVPAYSPDGKTIAFQSTRAGSGGSAVYSIDAEGKGPARRLTDGTANDGAPVWSPDGQRIAYRGRVSGHDEVFVMDPNGSSRKQVTPTGSGGSRRPRWVGN